MSMSQETSRFTEAILDILFPLHALLFHVSWVIDDVGLISAYNTRRLQLEQNTRNPFGLKNRTSRQALL